jgi:hypothetical protein
MRTFPRIFILTHERTRIRNQVLGLRSVRWKQGAYGLDPTFGCAVREVLFAQLPHPRFSYFFLLYFFFTDWAVSSFYKILLLESNEPSLLLWVWSFSKVQ